MSNFIHSVATILAAVAAVASTPARVQAEDGRLTESIRRFLEVDGVPGRYSQEAIHVIENADSDDLGRLLTLELERRSDFLHFVHIAGMASAHLPATQARPIVYAALAKGEEVNRGMRYMFAESVCQVASNNDAALVQSFLDTERRGINQTVAETLLRLGSEKLIPSGTEAANHQILLRERVIDPPTTRDGVNGESPRFSRPARLSLPFTVFALSLLLVMWYFVTRLRR